MTTKPKRPSAVKMRRQVDAWNKAHGIGETVRFWRGVRDGDGEVGVTASNALILGGHTAGIYISGPGFIALSHIEPFAESAP